MGLLDFIFTTTPHKKNVAFGEDKMKLTRQDIIDLVWSIDSLQDSQKEMIRAELERELDDGGVSQFEYKNIVQRLAEKRAQLGLSEVDVKNLRRVLG
ncbi:hypothetical protein GYA54_03520 [Candidatus Kuenenbacteria bacterium]|nr:hypothetical protein [Candidatus Kuenenbacteria bacterium]